MSEIDRHVLQTMVETAHDHSFIVGSDGTILAVSPGAEAVYGLSRQELLTSTVQQLETAGILTPSVSLEVMRTQRPAQLMQVTGTGRRVIAEAHPVFVEGTLERIISRSRDLTDLQLLQDEYALLQKRFSDHLMRNKTAPTEEEQSLEDELENFQIKSQVMREIALLLKRVAPSDASVLMLGESGVGKTAFAKQVHQWSSRRTGPFIDVNCAAIPDNLFESEMFGYQPGAFSGAARQGKAGVLEQAEGGTLFLDEIGELPLLMQTKLLKVIQDGRLTRLGDTRPRRVNFRLIVATNQNLAKEVEVGNFRLDLYYRLNVIPVTLPPLRDRREDIPGLAEACLQRLNHRYGQHKILSNTVWSTLMSNAWSGNVRELENWLERAWLSSPGDHIETPGESPSAGEQGIAYPVDLPLSTSSIAAHETLKDYLDRLEKDTLTQLSKTLTSTYAIAERLGTSQSSIVRRMQRYGLKAKGPTF